MADINTAVNAAPLLDEESLNRGMELLFFAYRDFTSDPEERLARVAFGRAHYRVLYFVARNPGIPVAALLEILRITKQSLSRVLGHLVAHGYVEQRRQAGDRRRRLLYLTEDGAALEQRLSDAQRARIARAFGAAGQSAVEGFSRVLLHLINEDDRRRLDPAPRPEEVDFRADGTRG